MARGSLLLDLHFCAGRSESDLPSHTTPPMSPLAQFLAKVSEAIDESCSGTKLSHGADCDLFYRVQRLLVLREIAEGVVVAPTDGG